MQINTEVVKYFLFLWNSKGLFYSQSLELKPNRSQLSQGILSNSDICDQSLRVVSRFHIFDYLSTVFPSRLPIFYTALKTKIVPACLCTLRTD